MRLFIAVPVPQTIRRELQLQADSLFDAEKLRLVRSEGIHITLLFLGEQEPSYVVKAEEIFRRLKNRLSRFTIGFSGIITFPQGGSPRVVAVPVIEGTKELRDMHRKLAEMLDGDKRKKFTPHITLGRVRKHVKGSIDVTQSRSSGSADSSALFAGSFTAERIVLYESVLDPAGALYRERASCQLS